MIQDLHSHTYYSFCGKDKPEEIIEAAINGGIELFGICDHAHGVGYGRSDLYIPAKEGKIFGDYGQTLVRYFDHIGAVKKNYADKINILRGIEINTQKTLEPVSVPANADISFFDYCLIENLDWEDSVTEGDLFTYAKKLNCPVKGVAHTDMFAHIEKLGEKPLDYFKRMAEENIFWEMNVSYDSIHRYREHEYVKRFLSDERQQEIVRKSGVMLSVGFDGHRVEDYLPERVKYFCDEFKKLGMNLVFEK